MKHRIDDETELEGKTIAKGGAKLLHEEVLLLVFEDGSYAKLAASSEYGGYRLEFEAASSDEELLFCGLNTKEEIDKMKADREEAHRKDNEYFEYATYIRLKRKYEGEGKI